MKTTAVALECKVTVNTVRNWARDYAEFLSEGATSTSADREFTGHDLEVLKYIALLRSEGLQRASIVQRLGETTFPEIDASPEDQPLTIVDTPDTRQDTPANALIVSTLDAMQRRLEALEQAKPTPVGNQRDGVVMFGVGFLAACGLFILLLLLFLVRGYL